MIPKRLLSHQPLHQTTRIPFAAIGSSGFFSMRVVVDDVPRSLGGEEAEGEDSGDEGPDAAF
ncbi:hypothetical protein HN018_19525 [Lichenicola cladoniae]|uniref:Uncharacterized protein n=1 Tax=Lichenicola cladoniae TaxID=1484109 RepID=A0A6M8HUD7_9PROT|nr:hypothetical protein [Lichenicola cladoniae]NPD66052.1 hypothetical protein [Acetobacteraceae bacterium]QKE91930.1 hypothetical protein HN018_19525 [Lichenicola cladoniae]